jgi:hypothetical protein
MLKLGRLDNLTETQRLELENKISAIGKSDLLKKFHDLLYSIDMVTRVEALNLGRS